MLLDECPMLQGNLVPVLLGKSGAGSLSLTTTSAASDAFTETMIVVFSPTSSCFIQVGSAPTATVDGTTDFLFGEQVSVPYLVRVGDKVAGIMADGTGSLYWSKVG